MNFRGEKKKGRREEEWVNGWIECVCGNGGNAGGG
jgi:hypothetical protein